MPTIMTHAIVPLAAAVALGSGRISPRIAVAGAVLAIMPDADVVGFKFGIAYSDDWGHRGATHSLVFGTVLAGLIALAWNEARSLTAFAFLALAAVSHGLLDTLTDGGLGAALWWPFDSARVFAPLTPIRVSPIGAGFFSARGLETLWSEVCWVLLPCAALAASSFLARRQRT
jgi:inner membrane protein